MRGKKAALGPPQPGEEGSEAAFDPQPGKERRLH